MEPELVEAHEPAKTTLPDRKPYHQFVHSICDRWPQLKHLDNFLSDIPCHPKGRPQTRIAVLDFDPHWQTVAINEPFTNSIGLQSFLNCDDGEKRSRIFIVENLSRDVVELLGARLHLDPAFFSSHIYGLDWFSRTSSPSMVPTSWSSIRNNSFTQLRYLEARNVKETCGAPYDVENLKLVCFNSHIIRKISLNKLSSANGIVGFARRQVTIWMNPLGDEGAHWIGACHPFPVLID
jgi:hypothetical protein